MNNETVPCEDAPLERPQPGTDGPPIKPSKDPQRTAIAICGIVFLVAVGCRFLALQDSRFEARKVQTAVTEGYKHTARLLREGGIRSFFSSDSRLSDPNHIGHPPGYSVLLAVAFGIFGESDSAIQIIQVLADAAAAVVVFFIALSLLNRTVATIAALLVALAPQFTYNSVLLLPDSIAVLPILVSVLLLVLAAKRPRLGLFIAAGALIGLSCWLRANALLLPLFITAIVPILMERGSRLRYALWITAGAILVIAPLTIRNFIVYDHFIPVSLGAGQTLLEGIADYDADRTLGIPNTDMGIMKWEAEIDQRPDYYGMLFSPDGVQRERKRIARGLGVIRSHPFWFFGVMVRRGASMLRLERVRIVSADPPVQHSTSIEVGTPPTWAVSPQDLIIPGDRGSNESTGDLMPDGQMLPVAGHSSIELLVSPPVSPAPRTDYVLKVPLRMEQGRIIIKLVGSSNNRQYASTIIETQDWKSVSEQPLNDVELPFVSGSADQVRLVVDNAGAQGVNPVFRIGEVRLYALGPASFTWTRLPRAVVRFIQRLFITAVMLPLTLLGVVLLLIRRQRKTLALLLVVPAYYMIFQSALHTEYRYVLAVHYFLFVIAAVAVHCASNVLWRAFAGSLRLGGGQGAAAPG